MIEIDRHNWNLSRLFFGITSIWATLGIVCNFLLLLTTVKTRSLRATCNILIAICAVGDIFHDFGTLLQFPLLFNYYLEMDSLLCDIIMFLPEMGIAVGCACIFCVGLDRMISVTFSIQYRSLNKLYYNQSLAYLILGSCGYVAWLMVDSYEQRVATCEILSPFLNKGIAKFANATVAINISSGIVYFTTWMGLRSQPASPEMKRIVKALFIIVTVDVCGWIITPGMFKLFQSLGFNEQQMFAWGFFSKIFINIALSIKIFIYYSTSSQYRSAIKAFLFKNKSSNSVSITIQLSEVR